MLIHCIIIITIIKLVLEDSGHNHVRGGHEIETDNDEDKIQTLDVDLDNPELREILTSPDFNGALESFENSSHPINGSNISYVDLISSLNLFYIILKSHLHRLIFLN